MSVYREQTTNMNDQECLVDALKEVKAPRGKQYNPEVHAEGVQLYGYHGDKRKEKAEIVLPRAQVGSASNDIGFVKGKDGNFTAIISDYDKSFHNTKWLDSLKQIYAKKKAIKSARAGGLQLLGEKVLPNGRIRLQFQQVGGM